MNPQDTSTGTSFLVLVAGIIGTVAANYEIVSADQKTALISALTTVLSALVAGGTILWKRWQHTPEAIVAAVKATSPQDLVQAVAKVDPTALIKAVNDEPNGVKVVSAASPSITVTRPLTGPGS